MNSPLFLLCVLLIQSTQLAEGFHSTCFVSSLTRNGSLLGRQQALKELANGNGADDFLSQLAGGFEFAKNPVVEGKNALIKRQAGNYDQGIIRAQLQAFIDENPVAMLSFTTCPYCVKAKQVLDSLGATYKTMELNTMPGLQSYAFRAELSELTGRTSVPAIWIGGEFVGGCNDGPMDGVVTMQQSGKLEQLLKNVGAL
uniref:Glutaredoxin domain-containing protein n=1 Tax=Entomoneis paludosa TaxID=265537 RepID=A0A7S2YNQ6_9STRA|mmetsp:Transcript_40259/g.83852  ORF Transcript_40259/g.83852 Transcript_40259/m.83852 type:complete len:199 (+) Transcript_40259:160-756(+)